MTLFTEALNFAETQGLLLDPLLEVLGTSSAGVPNIVVKYSDIRRETHNRFAVDSALKYLDLTTEAFPDMRNAPMLEAATENLRDASRRGAGAEDILVGRLVRGSAAVSTR